MTYKYLGGMKAEKYLKDGIYSNPICFGQQKLLKKSKARCRTRWCDLKKECKIISEYGEYEKC